MIMLASVVPYGGNAVRYALEKAKNGQGEPHARGSRPDRHLVHDEASL